MIGTGVRERDEDANDGIASQTFDEPEEKRPTDHATLDSSHHTWGLDAHLCDVETGDESQQVNETKNNNDDGEVFKDEEIFSIADEPKNDDTHFKEEGNQAEQGPGGSRRGRMSQTRSVGSSWSVQSNIQNWERKGRHSPPDYRGRMSQDRTGSVNSWSLQSSRSGFEYGERIGRYYPPDDSFYGSEPERMSRAEALGSWAIRSRIQSRLDCDKQLERYYPPDCFSFLSLHSLTSESPIFFLFGMMVFCFQMLFLLLMVMSVLDDVWSTNGDVDNPTSNLIFQIVSANASPLVRGAQFVSLLSYLIFADRSMMDVTTAIEIFPRNSRGISTTADDQINCMKFSCILRFTQGALALLVALTLIIASSSVVDIILNFTAINFISGLDDVAFQLALWGKYGPTLEDEAVRISNLPLPQCMRPESNHRRFQLTQLALAVFFVIVLGGLVYTQESDNVWLTKMLRVEFQDEILHAYSGCYELDKRASKSLKEYKRHVYTSIGKQQYNASFGYCAKKRRWMLYRNSTYACDADDGELAYSAKSFSFDISTSFSEGWWSTSGTPLDLYFVQLDKNQEDQCLSYDDGICHSYFNTFEHQYDGGDCCSATCSHSICGIGAVTEPFNVKNATGSGFSKCTDPRMFPITIHLENFTSSRAPENLAKRYSDKTVNEHLVNFVDDDTAWYHEDPVNPSLTLECDGKMALLLDISIDMHNRNETVFVNDGANCTIRLENRTSPSDKIGDLPTWHADYTVYHRNKAEKEIKILQMNSGNEGISTFVRVPTCMFERISEYFDAEDIYSNAPSMETLQWMLTDTIGNSDCDDKFFLDRYVLGLMHFGAPPMENGQQTRWIERNELCLWSSIECNNESLSDLSLKALNLQGTISTAIGLLVSLSRLDMSLNSVTGKIPREIRSLTNLEYLDLSGNILSGNILNGRRFAMESLTKLRSLSFYDNSLTGPIPSGIESMPDLTMLNLGSNNLSGQIPREIGNLTNLKNLVLTFNNFRGEIPSEIGSLTTLEYLDLSFNEIAGTIPSEIGELTKLENLDLRSFTSRLQDIHVEIPKEIGTLTNLKHLDFRYNGIVGIIPTEIGYLSILTELHLTQNKLSRRIPSEIGYLSSLELLDLGENDLSGEIPTEIGSLSSLLFLWIENNKLRHTIPTEIGLLTKLRSLSFDMNFLKGTIPTEIGLLTALTHLSLSNNELTGVIPSELGGLTSLNRLELFQGNNLSSAIPEEAEFFFSNAACKNIDIQFECPTFSLSHDNACKGPLQVITFTYNGGSCEQLSTNRRVRYVPLCIDSNGGPSAVKGTTHYITVVPKGGSEFYFADYVAVGESYTLNADKQRIKLSTVMTMNVFQSKGGTLLQTIEVNLPSCSFPVHLMDRFGAHQITEWVESDGRRVFVKPVEVEVLPVRIKSSTPICLSEIKLITNIGDDAEERKFGQEVLSPGTTLELDLLGDINIDWDEIYYATENNVSLSPPQQMHFWFTVVGEPLALQASTDVPSDEVCHQQERFQCYTRDGRRD